MNELIRNIIQEELENLRLSKDQEKLHDLIKRKYGEDWYNNNSLRDKVEKVIGDADDFDAIRGYYYIEKAISVWRATKDPRAVAKAIVGARYSAPNSNRKILDYLMSKGFVFWNDRSSYTFMDKKNDRLISKLVHFINEPTSIPKTRKNFLNRFHYIQRDRGFLSDFFAAAKRSGIVAIDKKTYEYKLGPNYQPWLEGRLVKGIYGGYGSPSTVGSF